MSTAIERCRAYLRRVDGAIEGQGGDNATFAAACICIDFGLSDSESLEVLGEWNQKCSPRWSDRDLEDKIKNARKYRRDPEGSKANEQPRSYTSRPAANADHGAVVLDPDDPGSNAARFVETQYTRDGERVLVHERGEFLEHVGTHWRPSMDGALHAQLWKYLHSAVRPGGAPFKPGRSKIVDTLDALRAETHVSLPTAPAWIGDPGIVPANEIIATKNGLLHYPTRRLLPHSPRFFCRNALSFAYDPNASAPGWLKFLDDVFQGDEESIQTLQEYIGLLMTPDTSHQKILLVHGPRRSGKGTATRIMVALIGEDNVCAPTLTGLATQFGAQALIGKLAALISDMRISKRTDMAVIAERLLSISGEDAITIDRKHIDAWTGRLAARFVIMTNELPHFSEASGALVGRFILLRMTQSFYGREDRGLTGRLLLELPGIFNWALDGLARLNARGHFLQPKSGEESIRAMEDLASPIATFVRERCEVGHGFVVECDALFRAWQSWCEDQGHGLAGSKARFGRNLRSVVSHLHVAQPREGDDRRRVYVGVTLAGTRRHAYQTNAREEDSTYKYSASERVPPRATQPGSTADHDEREEGDE